MHEAEARRGCPSLGCAPWGSSLCRIALRGFSFLSLLLLTLILNLFYSVSNEKNHVNQKKLESVRLVNTTNRTYPSPLCSYEYLHWR